MKWDDICSRCGLCCHEKTIYPDVLEIDLSEPCSFYDGNTHLCTVYEDRFRKCPRCERVTPLKAAFSRSLPPSCAYIRWAERHHIRFCRPLGMVLADTLSDRPS